MAGRSRAAGGEQADRQPRPLRPDNGRAIPDVKALRLRSVDVHRDNTVGEYTVNVEQQQPDAGCFFVDVRHVRGSGSEGWR